MSDTPAKPANVNVRISGTLRDHVERATSEGDYESVSEYVRDLIRKDKSAREAAAFRRVKAELQVAFAAPSKDYEAATADDIKALARRRISK